MNECLILSNKNLEVTFTTMGASVYRIRFHGEDMALTPKDISKYLGHNFYFGKTIGRVCGRIPLNSKEGYSFEDNNNGTSLHGGFNGLSNKEFSFKKSDNKIVFSYLSPDGEAGYPGNLKVNVIYELGEASLLVKFEASVDKPCLLALTNHLYFTLCEPTKDNLTLQFDNQKYLVVDNKSLLPIKFTNTPAQFNFKNGKDLKDVGEVDNYFSNDSDIIIKSKKYSLTIQSDFKGTVVYTDNFEDDLEMYGTLLHKHRAVAVEPQDNQLERKELLPGEIYQRYIRYTFKKL